MVKVIKNANANFFIRKDFQNRVQKQNGCERSFPGYLRKPNNRVVGPQRSRKNDDNFYALWYST